MNEPIHTLNKGKCTFFPPEPLYDLLNGFKCIDHSPSRFEIWVQRKRGRGDVKEVASDGCLVVTNEPLKV